MPNQTESTSSLRRVLTLPEWGKAELAGVSLNEDDLVLITSRDGFIGQRLDIRETKTGVSVQSKSWVGVIRLAGFDIHIVPKMAGENLGLIRLIDYAGGIDNFRMRKDDVPMRTAEDNLLELVVATFLQRVEDIVRKGLRVDYVQQDDALSVVRGRFLPDRQVMQRFGMLNRVECRYDEHTSDIPDNQIIRATLSKIRRLPLSAQLTRNLSRLETRFSSVSDQPSVPVPKLVKETLYVRANTNYREAHALAELIWQTIGVKDFFESGSIRTFAFLIDMNALFERFLERWLGDILKPSGLTVSPQVKHYTALWSPGDSKSIGLIQPDFIVSSRSGASHKVPIDAKYKAYDAKAVSNDDLYQAAVYAIAFSDSQSSRIPTTLILYPGESDHDEFRTVVVRNRSRDSHARIMSLGIHIPTAIESALSSSTCNSGVAISSKLLELAASDVGDRRAAV